MLGGGLEDAEAHTYKVAESEDAMALGYVKVFKRHSGGYV